jgi:hypothetical protein
MIYKDKETGALVIIEKTYSSYIPTYKVSSISLRNRQKEVDKIIPSDQSTQDIWREKQNEINKDSWLFDNELEKRYDEYRGNYTINEVEDGR